MPDERRIVSASVRNETPEEQALFAWFDAQQKDPVKPLEDGARQIISLVTAIYGIIFGILAFASNPLPTYLSSLLVRCLGAATVLSYLVALVGALAVVLPDDYRYARASKDQVQQVMKAIMRRKFRGLQLAVWSFGVGTVAFAILFLTILLA